MHLRPLPLLRHGACADETELARQLRPAEQRGAQLEVLREGDELRPLQQLHGQGGDCGGERACGLREVRIEDELREGRMALEEQPERRRAQLALDQGGLELEHPRQQVVAQQPVEGGRLCAELRVEALRQDGEAPHHVCQAHAGGARLHHLACIGLVSGWTHAVAASAVRGCSLCRMGLQLVTLQKTRSTSTGLQRSPISCAARASLVKP